MSSNGTAKFFFLPIQTTMNGIRHCKMLDKLKVYIFIFECNMIMQDSAPCHHSKLVSDFLKTKNIKMLDWPGNSLDLNLIENLWEH